MPLRLALNAMGTRFECVLHGMPHADLRAAGEEALESIAEVERWLSRFRKDSAIARINDAAGIRPVRVNAEVFDLLKRCEQLRELTDGAFDVTLGQRMEALGFWGDPKALQESDHSAEPSAGRRLLLNDAAGTCVLKSVGDQLDLGAIGKGYALDCAAEVLRDAEIPSALIHGGTSTSIALGTPEEIAQGQGWPLAISHPEHDRDPKGLSWIRLQLKDQALSVSAPHGRTQQARDDTGEVPHILDPRSQNPIPMGGLAMTVHESAAVADAWSTALLVMQSIPSAAPLRSLLLSRENTLLRHPKASKAEDFEVSEFG